MSIIKVAFLIIIVALLSPMATTVLDAVCWFYSGATCTGLVYDGIRAGVLCIATFFAFILAFALFA